MPISVQITGKGGRAVEVTPEGELVVGRVARDETEFRALGTPDVANSFYDPKPGKMFIITVLTGKANRDVSNTVDAEVIIYEASSDTSTTVDKILHQVALVRGEPFTLTGLRIEVTEGKWVNAKTDDAGVPMTIMGYYIDV